MLFVKDICDTAAHTCGEVFAGFAEDYNRAARHVLAAVVADTLNNRRCAGISYAEAFTGDAGNKGTACRGAVKGNVTDDDVFLGLEDGVFRRINRKLTAGKTFSEVVVAVSLNL